MSKETLIAKFLNNHFELSNYVDSLNEIEFLLSANEKWNAGQQVKHVILCLIPIDQALFSKEYIEKKFGKADRASLDYDSIINNYKSALSNGGKAPERYLPAPVLFEDKQALNTEFKNLLISIENKLGNYSETELDTLVLPHPLMGMMTIRELLFLMTYHATHHLEQVKITLGLPS